MNTIKTIIRPDPVTGRPDDIVIENVDFRMERMDDNTWWLAVYRGDKRISFAIGIESTGVELIVEEDELGAVDDTGKAVPVSDGEDYALPSQ